jgi:CDP-diacylglycerol--glycerol-3-phosphate 3-phosphatidyltransferase
MTLDKQAIKDKSRRILDPLVSGLVSLGVPPMLISVLGLVFSIYGAVLLAGGSLFWSGIWLIISGVCDILDGSVARRAGRSSKFGAFIDSTFDRISELVYFGAILVYYINRSETYGSLMFIVIWIALGGSFLVSYTRSRVEGLGQSCTIGYFERPERLTLLIVGLILGHRMLSLALTVMALGTIITVLQRIHHAHEVLGGPAQDLARKSDDQPPLGTHSKLDD